MWVRKGTCQPDKCGAWCCKFLGQDTAVVSNPKGLSDPDYYRARGAKLFHVEGIPVQATIQVQRYSSCPKLDNCLKCTIYSTRPNTCRDFPTDPKQIENTGCTYWFEEVE